MSRLYFVEHSSFLWEGEAALLLFDYYGKGAAEALVAKSPAKPLYLLTTHSHYDHYSPIIFTAFMGHPGGVHYLLHEELYDKVPASLREGRDIHFISTGERYADATLALTAYGSTDLGGSFYCEVEGVRLFHAGDLNNWHWNEEAAPHYVEQYEQAWYKELAHLTSGVKALDLLMFPTDLRLGKDYLKGLRQLLCSIKVRYLAPMHINGQLDPEELQALAMQHQIELLLPHSQAPYYL